MQLTIRAATPDDWLVWERLRYALWPGEDETHGEVICRYFAGERKDPGHVLLAETDSVVSAFAELSIRTDLPGLSGERVGYIEGLYVVQEMRHCGVAKSLVDAARQWARDHACVGFASDRDDRLVVDRQFTARRWSDR